MNSNFSSWPSYTEEEAVAVQKILLSNRVNYWTGDEGRKFEKEFSILSDVEYSIAVANGTLALDLALNALGVGARNGGSEKDEVVVTSRTFLASVSSIIFAGAIPVFADVGRDNQNISAETISDVLTDFTRAIIAVHLGGWPCEMDDIMALSDHHDLFVIEDCAQAHGAKYKGKSVGSIGHIGCWSFCQDKIMTTGGEGGMVTTNDKNLWSKMWSYKDHGKSWEAVYEREHPPGFRWLHDSFGTNWRLTEMQSAIGRIQLRRMPQWSSRRLENAQPIWGGARKCAGLRVPEVPEYILHAAYKCYVFVEPEFLKDEWSRDRIMAAINSNGVPCYSGSCSEVYLEKAFEGTNFRPKERLKVAKELGETSLMFLVHPTLKDDEIEKTCRVLKKVMEQASK